MAFLLGLVIIREHSQCNARLTRGDRYRKERELLDSVHRDVTMEGDDPQSQGLQRRIIAHVDEARRTGGRLEETDRR